MGKNRGSISKKDIRARQGIIKARVAYPPPVLVMA